MRTPVRKGPAKYRGLFERAAVATVILGLATPLAAQVPSDVVAHWQLDGNAQDASANQLHGTPGPSGSGPAWTSSGKIGGALTFDGVDDQVEVVNVPTSMKNATFAISAWVNYSATDSSGGEVATLGDSYGLRVISSGEVRAYFYAGGSSWPTLTSTGANVRATGWHHLVGQYTGSSVQIYVDGQLKGTLAASGPISYTLGTNFYLGRHGFGGTNHHYNGTIDQVRVYGRALTSTEISALAAEAPPSSGITFKVLTWNLQKARGTDNSDSVNAIADWIKAHSSADVLLLSAVDNATEAAAIKDRLNAPNTGPWNVYFAQSPSTSEGQAILSRFDMPNGTGDRDFHEVVCSGATENQVIVKATVVIDGREVNFFAIDQQHMSSLASVRLCQAQAFSAWASGFAEPRIIGGDFNETNSSSNPGMTHWVSSPPTGAGYDDLWLETPSASRFGYPSEPWASGTGTATGNTNGRTRTSRIDHLLASEGITGLAATEAQVWDTRQSTGSCSTVVERLGSCDVSCNCQFVDDKRPRPSDHIPLTVVVTIP